MHKSLSLAMRAALVAGVVGFMAGCSNVTPEQLSAVEAKASEALSKAGTASANADKALKTATEAAAAAQAAQSAADAAMACCNDNKTAIDKMFQDHLKK
jgi:Alanine-zipper, major outer membrane lipoprotein